MILMMVFYKYVYCLYIINLVWYYRLGINISAMNFLFIILTLFLDIFFLVIDFIKYDLIIFFLLKLFTISNIVILSELITNKHL